MKRFHYQARKRRGVLLLVVLSILLMFVWFVSLVLELVTFMESLVVCWICVEVELKKVTSPADTFVLPTSGLNTAV